VGNLTEWPDRDENRRLGDSGDTAREDSGEWGRV
jgi:hypothetical protein